VNVLRKEYRWTVFENRVLRETFVPTKEEDLQNYIMRTFVICTW